MMLDLPPAEQARPPSGSTTADQCSTAYCSNPAHPAHYAAFLEQKQRDAAEDAAQPHSRRTPEGAHITPEAVLRIDQLQTERDSQVAKLACNPDELQSLAAAYEAAVAEAVPNSALRPTGFSSTVLRCCRELARGLGLVALGVAVGWTGATIARSSVRISWSDK